MANKSGGKRIKGIIYCVLSFILSLIFFTLSYSIVLEVTLFNKSFYLENMNAVSYFADKKNEIVRSLTDLGYASGLDEEFFKGVVDEVSLNELTQQYLDNYFDGKGTEIDTTDFQQTFTKALDKYIADNNITVSDASSRNYMTKRAMSIYRNSLEIPLFSAISAYFLKIKFALPFVIVGCIILIALIIILFVKTTEWKHRAVKYTYYATAGSFLSVMVVPAYVLLSKGAAKINLTSRALYHTFVQCSNSIMIALLICALLLGVTSLALAVQHHNMKKKVSES